MTTHDSPARRIWVTSALPSANGHIHLGHWVDYIQTDLGERVQNDFVVERAVRQLFDPKAGVFLAERFVKGRCPKGDTPTQYGDSCDNCGSTYSPTELKDPVSTLSGARPELKSALHLFVK